jgi:2-polyprenyl-3-methyl-5-hydroxy-6-metoxy-1,4-benzoquinol methylase
VPIVEHQAIQTLVPLPFEPAPSFANWPFHNDVEKANAHGKKIGILVVTYNAVNTVRKVLQRIPPPVWENIEEIAIFDDASPDATYELVLGLKAVRHIPKLVVLKHAQNLGYGGNQKAGYQYFIDKGFDIAILLHGDGQYAPEVLSHMYAPIVEGKADAVFGSRMMTTYGGPLKGGMPLYKYVGNRILTVIENGMLSLKLTEFHSGYRAYNLHALQKIDFSKMTNDFHFDTEIIIKLQHQHMRIFEVPIPTYYGDEICHVNGMKYAKDVVRAVYRYQQTKRAVAKFPEFEEYFVHYPIKFSKGSSHYYARQLVGQGKKVLNVGCGEGELDADLIGKQQARITGIDILAEPRYQHLMEAYYQADLNQGLGAVADSIRGQNFDRVLFLDILEHLGRPEMLLRQCRDALAPDGEVVVSVPNVANITIRLLLLLGQWNYTERGILDRTHARFFTRKTARRLVESQGYRIVQEKLTVMPLELALGLDAENPLMRLINYTLRGFTKLLPGLLGYQVILVAKKQ